MRKWTMQLKKWVNDLNRHLTKEDIQITLGREFHIKQQWYGTTHLLEGLKSQTPAMSNACEDVE